MNVSGDDVMKTVARQQYMQQPTIEHAAGRRLIGERVVFKAADHRVVVEDVRAALRRELGLTAPAG